MTVLITKSLYGKSFLNFYNSANSSYGLRYIWSLGDFLGLSNHTQVIASHQVTLCKSRHKMLSSHQITENDDFRVTRITSHSNHCDLGPTLMTYCETHSQSRALSCYIRSHDRSKIWPVDHTHTSKFTRQLEFSYHVKHRHRNVVAYKIVLVKNREYRKNRNFCILVPKFWEKCK